MICAYPLYVKKDIMATNGDFVKRDAVGPGGSQSAPSSQGAGSQKASGSSSGMEGLLDAAVEESIGRRLLLRSRTRKGGAGSSGEQKARCRGGGDDLYSVYI
jgi:hypothetical protein